VAGHAGSIARCNSLAHAHAGEVSSFAHSPHSRLPGDSSQREQYTNGVGSASAALLFCWPMPRGCARGVVVVERVGVAATLPEAEVVLTL
jgi:hypothetical protein